MPTAPQRMLLHKQLQGEAGCIAGASKSAISHSMADAAPARDDVGLCRSFFSRPLTAQHHTLLSSYMECVTAPGVLCACSHVRLLLVARTAAPQSVTWQMVSRAAQSQLCQHSLLATCPLRLPPTRAAPVLMMPVAHGESSRCACSCQH
jgi:hypothetical protein